mmetsp:Transcript_9437/g.14239  ORF Transcript_9437/g.14239 Transcript_9437/m.14239 type:complete len:259 (+) Transcript_9437:70-846(+)
MPSDSNGYKVYIGNCEGISETDIRDEFRRFGKLEHVWLARNPPGFAFVWFADERDAIDAVEDLDNRQLCGKILRVEMSRQRPPRRESRYDDRYSGGGDRYGSRYDGGGGGSYGAYGRNSTKGSGPLKTGYKVRLSNMPVNTHWTELKDFMRKAGDVIYTNVENGEGMAEFVNREGMERACKELDDTYFRDRRIRVDMQDESDRYRKHSRSPRRSPGYVRGRGRSYSPRERSRSPISYRRSRSRSHSRSRSVSQSPRNH